MRLVASVVGLAILGAGWMVANSFAQTAGPSTLSSERVGALVGPRVIYLSHQRPALLLPDGQRRAVHSVLNNHRPMQFGDYIWDDSGVAKGPVWLRVDLGQQTISIFRAGHEIGSAVVIFGTDGKPTPTGVFPVLAKAQRHRSTLYDAEMPFMLRLTGDGVAIHASNVRKGFATHGCIGVPPIFARLIFDQVQIGDQVAVIRS